MEEHKFKAQRFQKDSLWSTDVAENWLAATEWQLYDCDELLTQPSVNLLLYFILEQFY